MRPTSRIAALLLAAFVAAPALAAPALAAQAKPDFSGTWVMVPEKSDLGGMPSPGGRTDVIAHQEPKLTIKRTIGDATMNLVYAVDGQPWKNTIPQGEVTSTLKWDGDVLVMQSAIALQGNERFGLPLHGQARQAHGGSLPGQCSRDYRDRHRMP